MKISLPKIIAMSGYSSRRQAEKLIRSGQVKINGRLALLGETASLEEDKITIQGKPLPNQPGKIYIKLNKPLGYTCTNRIFEQEKNIFSLVRVPERLFAVGRLDKDSRGLILLTNDGELTQQLSHPSFEHEKTYEVKVKGDIKDSTLIIKKLIGGLDIGEGDDIAHTKAAQYLQNNLFILTLTEGKKRQIRRMFLALGLTVIDLKRTNLANLSLGNLKEGHWKYLSQEEINNLKKYEKL